VYEVTLRIRKRMKEVYYLHLFGLLASLRCGIAVGTERILVYDEELA
jgi:hypothetical protein